MEKEIVDW